MNGKVIGNHGGVWGIEHDAITAETLAKAHGENYWRTLLAVSDEVATELVGRPVVDEYDSTGNLVTAAVWPQRYLVV